MLFGPKLFITLFSVLLSRYKRTKKSRLHEYLLKHRSIFPRETNLSRTGGTSNSVSLLTPASHSRSGAGWENRPCFLTQIFMRPTFFKEVGRSRKIFSCFGQNADALFIFVIRKCIRTFWLWGSYNQSCISDYIIYQLHTIELYC